MPQQQESILANRLIALALVLCCGGLLVFAETLTPATAGTGTHTQMGLPECGFAHATGLPCATCGCTTAFAHAADGAILDAFITQPFGATLALGLAMLTLLAGWSIFSGMSLAPVGQMLANKPVVLMGIGLLLAAWAYKAVLVAAGG